jgi:hypothetical protein
MEDNKFKDYTLFPFVPRLCRDPTDTVIGLYNAIKQPYKQSTAITECPFFSTEHDFPHLSRNIQFL